MKDKMDKSNLVFSISLKDIQEEAKRRIGREVEEDEIYIVKKGLESGLLTSIDIVYHTIFTEMIEENI